MASSSLLPHTKGFSFENMRQQPLDLFKELTALFTKFKSGEIDAVQLGMGYDEIVFRYKKIKVKFEYDDSIEGQLMANAGANRTFVDGNHPFWNIYQFRDNPEFWKMMRSGYKSEISWVDTNTGGVDGWFSTIEIKTTLTKALADSLEPDELAATMLHEIGHTYVDFFYVGHAATSSLVISIAVREALGEDDLGKRKKILNDAKQVLGIQKFDTDSLVGVPTFDDTKNLEVLYLNAYRQQLKSTTGTDLYELRNAEQMADQYAVRHGAGVALARALQKMERVNTAARRRYMFKMVVSNLPFIVLTKLSMLAAHIGSLGMLLILQVWQNTLVPDIRIYDNDRDRFKLIKQHMVARMKASKVSGRDLDEAIREIEKVERMMAKVPKESIPLLRRLALVLGPDRRKETNTYEMMKILEGLINNDLFITTAKLKNLGASDV